MKIPVTLFLLANLTAARDGNSPARELNGSHTRCRAKETKNLAELNRANDSLKKLKTSARKGDDIFGRSGSVEIRVHFHIITLSSGEGDISDEVIDEQLDVLNEGYSGNDAPGCGEGNGASTDTPFRFVKSGVDRTANDAWWTAEYDSKEEKDMMESLRVGDCSDLNVYVLNLMGLLGSAAFPTDCDTFFIYDGVLLHYETLPGGDFVNFNLGDTLVHEVGHWLGLFHTFSGGCSDPGDYVDDTPPQLYPTNYCGPGWYMCDEHSFSDDTSRENIGHNFMDYTEDCCLYQFTIGQTERMGFMYQNYRLGTSIPLLFSDREDLLVYDGIWGDWTSWNGVIGSDGFYACGAELRFQDPFLFQDNTAANGLRLTFCSLSDWYDQKEKTIFDGAWGSWKGWRMCPIGHFVTGAQVRFQDVVIIDNTALNGLKIWCTVPEVGTGMEVEVFAGARGKWKPWVRAEGKKFMTMSRLRFQDPVGLLRDDTAWNGLELRFEGLVYDTISPSSPPSRSSRPSHSSPPSAHPTITLSVNPTKSSPPSNAPPTVLFCNEEEKKFSLEIIPDLFGFETSWDVRDGADDVVAFDEIIYYSNETYHFSTCLVDSYYLFTVYDLAGDGMCCLFGDGSFKVTWGDEVFIGGDFKFNTTVALGMIPASSLEYSFSSRASPSFISTPSTVPTELVCNQGEKQLSVNITTDNFALETFWAVTDLTGHMVANGTDYENNANYVMTTCLLDGCYQFLIQDGAGNGICCANGNGSYTVTWDYEVSIGGEFLTQEIVLLGCGFD